MSAELVNYLSGFIQKRKVEKFDNILSFRTRYINVVCEDIFQSHNASAIIRNCECFGIQDIHIIEDRNNFEINTEIALGASKWIDVHSYNRADTGVSDVYNKLRTGGYRIVATSPHKEGVSLQELNLEEGPLALVFGTEKDGLTLPALEEADQYVSIDMFGFTESMNVSVSAGIILHYLRLKLAESNIKWQLPEKEKLILKLDWLRKTIKRPDLLEAEFYRKRNG